MAYQKKTRKRYKPSDPMYGVYTYTRKDGTTVYRPVINRAWTGATSGPGTYSSLERAIIARRLMVYWLDKGFNVMFNYR